MVEKKLGTYDRLLESIKPSSRLYPELGNVCARLDELSCSDLNSVLIAMSAARAEKVSARDVITGNKFTKESGVNPRDIWEVEGLFYADTELEFIDLSPVQPFGINTLLTGTSEKKIIPGLRGTEVNADPTTAIFRIAYGRFLNGDGDDIRLASNSRSVRAQNFGDGSKLLQHFKTFSEVTVGEQGKRFGEREVEAIIKHLVYESDCIDKVVGPENSIVLVSNLIFTRELQRQGRLDVERLLGRMREYNRGDYIGKGSVSLGDLLKDSGVLDELGITSGRKIMELFVDKLSQIAPDYLPRVKVDLSRVAGKDYYRHICYKIIGVDKDGEPFPLADGGSTDWAQRLNSNKQTFTVASGVGTELMAKHFIKVGKK